MPIELRAACDPVRMEALFSDGLSGEEDASARKRRSPETHNTNPTSSFRRRFLVGEKTFVKDVMWQRRRRVNDTRSAVTRPEPDNYGKKGRIGQCGKRGGVASWVPGTQERFTKFVTGITLELSSTRRGLFKRSVP